MRRGVVIDTNVLAVASECADQACPECVTSCVNALIQARDSSTVLLDAAGEILDEYRGTMATYGQQGVGWHFFLWAWDHQLDEPLCRAVSITARDGHGYEEFPVDAALASFDPSDRKFVAVARASQDEGCYILNAADTDWWDHREALARNGVNVVFLCPELMQGN